MRRYGSSLQISDRVAHESEFLSSLRALGSSELDAASVPEQFACALPLLVRVVSKYWDLADADVLPLLEPARATLAPALHAFLAQQSTAALAALALLSDFVGLERVRSACVYVLVKDDRLSTSVSV